MVSERDDKLLSEQMTNSHKTESESGSDDDTMGNIAL